MPGGHGIAGISGRQRAGQSCRRGNAAAARRNAWFRHLRHGKPLEEEATLAVHRVAATRTFSFGGQAGRRMQPPGRRSACLSIRSGDDMTIHALGRARRGLSALLACLLIPLLCAPSARAQSASGWTLVFHDEFDDSSLDTGKWNTTYMWGGEGARTLSGNDELQVYLDDQFEFRGDGVLRIRAERKDTVWHDKTYRYASGLITTYQKFARQKGYFEMRARLPSGKGLWPAFWMLLDRPSWPPEIDIMEVLGQAPSTVYMSKHSNADGDQTTLAGIFDTSAAFHVYGLEWSDAYLTWYLDGLPVARTARSSDMDEPMQLLVNLAVGGHWPGAPDASTVFPAYLEVDYVRAWRRDSPAAAVPGMTNGKTFVVGNLHTGMALRPEGAGAGNNVRVVQNAYNDTWASQRWVVRPVGGGDYAIVNSYTGKALRPRDGAAGDGVDIVQYDYNAAWDSQKWNLVRAGNGHFAIINKYTGKALRPKGAGTADGAGIVQETYRDTWNSQKWKIVVP
ncbi:family 16 glycosylhydrolase [Luteimonas salinilitoris]|uniref:family 16 glycosylhydrolase n=1 Tax=Luteimonas salinilitoris TaxID=3237697 RepID=UPI00351C565F